LLAKILWLNKRVADADPDDFTSMRLFAAHVYYRALITIPSLVRDWLTTYNDRGTQATVTAYTSTYFSAPIISSELSRIRNAEKRDLEADNFVVKLAAAVREVSAIYTVDDQQLEFTLKIPSNWPLQRIELRDSKLVGVNESQWRGWLLGVQQVVWSQVTTQPLQLRTVTNTAKEWAYTGCSYTLQNQCCVAFPRSG
jgi:hypothetical protein